ncbi:hypothetical protein [Pseudoroseicyclus aestuarii]|uniref:Secreted protein n=1 Tax=Pseudoroseicyclus aestuarii TaxID=1795041 RepID=A0A318SQH8_9RHOB|nr:hypothetical protein [Pseudoroseicyclus aestuarii]PYE84141.1 hypothetical protein DFP88_103508 [Pseudoroseicyclus aestuarii]
MITGGAAGQGGASHRAGALAPARLLACLALAALPGLAAAQADVPVFDSAAPYIVTAVTTDGGLIVDSQGQQYLCGMAALPQAMTVADCRPFLSPAAATGAAPAALPESGEAAPAEPPQPDPFAESAPDQAATEAFEALSDEEVVVLLRGAIERMGCSFDYSDDAALQQSIMAEVLAVMDQPQARPEGALAAAMVRRLDTAFETLTGSFDIDMDTTTATLQGCGT